MIKKSFSVYDMTVIVISLLSYLLDIISDIFIIVVFYLDGHYVWGSLSLAFLALSSVSMLLFSFRWHITDKTLTWKNFLPHVVFLAPLHRYIEVLRLGYISRKTKQKDDLDAALRANVDVSLLRLIEAFTESAPQLVLQLYIMLKFSHYNWLIGVSTVLSLTSVAFSLTAYSDALKMAYKEHHTRSWFGVTILTIWQSWMLLSRVTALVVFSLVFQAWVFLGMGVHWIFMTFWITMQNAEYGDTACEKRLFNSISGFIYIFCFLNLKEGPSKSRMAAFYCFVLAENALMMLLWFIYKPETTPAWLEITSLSLVFGGFVLGGILMIGYYCCCHPTGRTAETKKEITAYWFKRANSLPDRNRDPIFPMNNSVARVADWLNASISLSTTETSRYSNLDNMSLNFSLPDILKNGTYYSKTDTPDSSKNLNNSRYSFGRRSRNRNHDWNGTVTSTKSSYLSTSSSRPLINYSPPSVSYISNSKDTFSFSNHVLLDPERSASVASLSNSERAFALTGQNAKSPQHEISIDEDSFYAPPEYKASACNLSPLDPKKLWDESQNRLNNTANQIIQIITTTNLKRRTSESQITWRKLDTAVGDSNQSQVRQKYDNSLNTDNKYSDNLQQIAHEYYENSNQNDNSGTGRSLQSSDEDLLESSNKENMTPNDKSLRLSHRSSREYSSVDYGASTLSNFFGDISSFHVNSPEVGEYYMSSASQSKLNSIEEDGSEDYNNSLRSWSKKMLNRIQKQLHDGTSSTEYHTSDTTPSLTSSYVQEENTRSINSYGTSLSSNHTSQSRLESSSSNFPEMSSSYIHDSSELRSRMSTSDIGETSGSLSSGHRYNRYSSATDKSTDDSGYSVAKSQSMKCLNGEKLQNSLTFVTKLGSDGEFSTKLGSDGDFPDTFNRTNSHKQLENVASDDKITSDMKNAKSLPGLSYLLSESDTTSWHSDKSVINKTPLHNEESTSFEDITLADDSATVLREDHKSVRFEDQTPVKTLQRSNLTPVKVAVMSNSPFRPGKIIREDLTPVKLEKFSNSPSRPGKSLLKKSSISKPLHRSSQDSTLSVSEFDDSPHRLGRSIDLFDRERYKNSVADITDDVFTKSSDIKVRELENSPYKFRSKDNFDYEESKENVYGSQRRQSSTSSQHKYSSEPKSRNGSRYLSEVETNKTYNVQKNDSFTNIKPRTILDDFKKKHVPRNTQKKAPAYTNDLSLYQSEAATNPCYAYSDTESEAEISRRSNKDLSKDQRVRRHSSHFRTPVQNDGKRQVLRRLDNTPGFSPILTAGDRQIIQSSESLNSGSVIKPIVSTPKINSDLYKEGLRYIDDSPGTIEV